MFEERLRPFHPASVVGFRRPDGSQVTDEFLEDRQSCARHGYLPIMPKSDLSDFGQLKVPMLYLSSNRNGTSYS
jgi:hypothetical protein